MVMLKVMPDDAPGTTLLSTTDFDTAAARLADDGVLLRQWPLAAVTEADMAAASTDGVLAMYADEVTQIRGSGKTDLSRGSGKSDPSGDDEGFTIVDCVKLMPEDSDQWRAAAAAARQTFLAEHQHSEDEVRFFVAGVGCFYLHIKGQVLAVICEPGDLLSVPAGTTHWFDMGPTPTLCAIRFFEREDGWVGDFTGNPIASDFPDLPELLAGFAAADKADPVAS